MEVEMKTFHLKAPQVCSSILCITMLEYSVRARRPEKGNKRDMNSQSVFICS